MPRYLTIEEIVQKSQEWRREPSAPALSSTVNTKDPEQFIKSKGRTVSRIRHAYYLRSRPTETGKDGSQPPKNVIAPHRPPGWDSSGKPPKLHEGDKKICMPFIEPEKEIPINLVQIKEEVFVPEAASIKRDACQPSYTLLIKSSVWKREEIKCVLDLLKPYCFDHKIDWPEGGKKLLLMGGMWPKWLFCEIIKRSNKEFGKRSNKPDLKARQYALFCELPREIREMIRPEPLELEEPAEPED